MAINDVVAHMIYRIRNTRVRPWPFAHIYVEGIFPTEFYSRLLNDFPRDEDYIPLVSTGRVGPAYSEKRLIAKPSAFALGESGAFFRLFQAIAAKGSRDLLNAFDDVFATPFGTLQEEFLLMRDLPGYALGPHTDSPRKVISALFYLPRWIERGPEGTSLYVPRDPTFRCAGGPHYPFDRFERVKTFPYVPNTMMAFVKSDVSFHGVEPITRARNVLLYDVKVK